MWPDDSRHSQQQLSCQQAECTRSCNRTGGWGAGETNFLVLCSFARSGRSERSHSTVTRCVLKLQWTTIVSVLELGHPHNAVNWCGSFIVMRHQEIWDMVKYDVSCRDKGDRPHKNVNSGWGFLQLPFFFSFMEKCSLSMFAFLVRGETQRTCLWQLVSVVNLTQFRVT